ncbi:LLM class flavin-dependent oxidoreductase [Bradyrhizobium ontarionense]|uniref:LLM class flavin-dependent oxidoreductase n=1 Tax=Bradyrhizobium ontarionense TaxID=2898149 RepID=A0ABY3RM74_9BRAD|nr:LLM class flavin-dependent oxidoreductase [Bradyrhizobium sp. A19]UFZ08162.1 LLM class flavin-dependent oxidoreductase [Bradyrhizobium sp. A19]
MKFSLFFEMQVPDPTPDREVAVFRNCVEQAKLADELGYHCIWGVEHHGLYEYSHSSAPEIFLAYVAAQTKRIRIGHGCTLLPHRYNHPIRIAERIATLDILSQGRVNWGTAKSGTRVEREAFEIDADSLHAQWREAVEMIPRMWETDVFSHKGRFFDIPPTCIVPKPVQKPHPPIFAACSKPEQAVEVGELGLGALNLAIYQDEMLAKRVSAYRAAMARAKPLGRQLNNHFACNPATLVLKDDRRACQYGFRGALFFLKAMVHYYGVNRPVGRINISRDFLPDDQLQRFMDQRNTPQSQLSSIIGDPSSAREMVQRFVDVGVDELILVMQTGTTPHEITMESIRTFGEEVMPQFS